MILRSIPISIFLLSTAAAQSEAPSLTFDVVSVKPAVRPHMDGRGVLTMARTTGGPGSTDPGRIHYPYATVKGLVLNAYQVKDLQISGPDWLSQDTFDISATMPPSTTKEQFRVMLQNLLAERFHVVLHRETREVLVYTMVIAKGGSKLKESQPVAPPPEAPPSDGPMLLTKPKLDSDGFLPQPFPPGRAGIIALMGTNGQTRIAAQMKTMHDLAEHLTLLFDRPVTDATGLTAKYDFVVNFSDALHAPSDSAVPQPDVQPTLLQALQSQLGLKLEPGKGPLEMIIIDHVDRMPTGN